MLLAGTLAVLWLGGISMQAVADTPPPPCHEAMAGLDTPAQPHHAPDKPMKSMGCCIACVTALDLPVVRSMKPPTAAPVSDHADALPTGRSPAPEHGPPKV